MPETEERLRPNKVAMLPGTSPGTKLAALTIPSEENEGVEAAVTARLTLMVWAAEGSETGATVMVPVRVQRASPAGLMEMMRVAGVVVRLGMAWSHLTPPVLTVKAVGWGVEIATVWEEGAGPPKK